MRITTNGRISTFLFTVAVLLWFSSGIEAAVRGKADHVFNLLVVSCVLGFLSLVVEFFE